MGHIGTSKSFVDTYAYIDTFYIYPHVFNTVSNGRQKVCGISYQNMKAYWWPSIETGCVEQATFWSH